MATLSHNRFAGALFHGSGDKRAVRGGFGRASGGIDGNSPIIGRREPLFTPRRAEMSRFGALLNLTLQKVNRP